MNQREARTAYYLFLPLSLTLLAASIVIANGARAPLSDEAYDQIELFTRVSSLIESKYVEEVDTWSLLYASLRGMADETVLDGEADQVNEQEKEGDQVGSLYKGDLGQLVEEEKADCNRDNVGDNDDPDKGEGERKVLRRI